MIKMAEAIKYLCYPNDLVKSYSSSLRVHDGSFLSSVHITSKLNVRSERKPLFRE